MAERRRSKVRGEGAVFQRKGGSWIAKYQHAEYTRGKPLSRRANSKREAYLKLGVLKQQLFGGKLAHGTATDIVQAYIKRRGHITKRNAVTPQNFDRIESTVETYVSPKFRQFKMTSIFTEEVQDYLNDLFDDGESYSITSR